MTKSELISSLAEKVRLPDYQSVDFMEIFLDVLRKNQGAPKAVSFEGIGEFRVIKISGGKKQDSTAEIEAVLFKGDGEFSGNSFLFNIPAERESSSTAGDGLLNLSFDKPVLAAESDSIPGEGFTPGGGLQSEQLREKANELFESGTAVPLNEEDVCLTGKRLKEILNNQDKSSEMWDALSEQAEQPDSGNDDLAWEFGADWKREVEQEEIFKELQSADWDFGGEVQEPKDTSTEISFEDLFDDADSASNTKEGLTPVGSMTRELQIDLSEFDDDKPQDHFKDTFLPPDPTKFESNQDLDSLFKKSIAESFIFAVPDPELKKEEERRKAQKAREEAYKENEYSLRRRMEEDDAGAGAETEEGADFISLKNLRKGNAPDGFDPSKLVSEHKPQQTKVKKSILWGVLSTIFVVVVGVSLYIYRFGIPPAIDEYLNPVRREELPPIVATVIERDYFVPVSYPYAPVLTAGAFPVLSTDSSLFMQKSITPTGNPVKKDSIVQIIPKTEASKTEGKPAIPEQPKVKPPESNNKTAPSSIVKDNIFKEGDIYTVQVSSWPNWNKADDEIRRLSGLGYPAYIQEAVIPGRGKWYRVRVGKYYNLQEAEDMAGKLK